MHPGNRPDTIGSSTESGMLELPSRADLVHAYAMFSLNLPKMSLEVPCNYAQ